MLNKLNIALNTDKKEHAYYLLMDDISQSSVRPVIEWIFDANFAEERPDMLNLMICSPGGDLTAGFALIDVMRGSSIPIRTIGLGQIASAGLMIFIAGKKGERILTPNTSILSHQFSWGSFGKAHELFAVAKEFDLTTQRMISHYKKSTGMNDKTIRDILLPAQDVWLSAEEALNYGICDHVKDMK